MGNQKMENDFKNFFLPIPGCACNENVTLKNIL